ncbi:MAG: FHA domain-containing protein [Desulfobacterales bacterium]|jgi:pSer/pThr/pTyr-binding forkhead associated (FHA) protein
MFKLIQKSNPKNYFETPKESFLVGKSKRCEIVIGDPKISDIQAKVSTKDSRYFIKNLGSKPISLNGSPIGEQFLKNGDELALGKSKFVIQTEDNNRQPSRQMPMEDKTLVFDNRSEESLGPRLVCTTPNGKSKIVPLKLKKLIIGRSNEAALKLMHPSISRKHCVIEKRKNGFYARNISTTNPLYLNNRDISEQRLFSGDKLQIGTFSITFISDEKADTRQATQKIITKHTRSNRGVWLAALLIFTFSGYLLYIHAYTPWKTQQKLTEVAKQIERGDYLPASDALEQLLLSDISSENAQTARDMLAQITLAVTRQKAEKGKVEEAKAFLKKYLAEYGHGKEAAALWDRLDFYRLTLGEQLESANQHQSALREYSSIREDSLYFEEAQKAIRRIWLAYQKKTHQKQDLAQLLKEAETHFLARRYLTPVNKNAFAAYQAILSLDPKHDLALQRIEQIKTFYREHGDGYYKKGNWPMALSYFERYSIIDPESSEIKAKISACRQKIASSRKGKTKSGRGKNGIAQEEENQKREEVQRLLEETGTESSWIMKYLFEEQAGEKNSDTPW